MVAQRTTFQRQNHVCDAVDGARVSSWLRPPHPRPQRGPVRQQHGSQGSHQVLAKKDKQKCLFFCHCCPFNNLEMTRKITQVASEDAGDRGAWLKGSREDFPHLPLPPNQFFKETIAANVP